MSCNLGEHYPTLKNTCDDGLGAVRFVVVVHSTAVKSSLRFSPFRGDPHPRMPPAHRRLQQHGVTAVTDRID